MDKAEIKIVGAKQHNLKNLTVSIPKFKTTVITGLSGSGKSSLAFDTLYAEGQRRYVESLSTYAKQFLSGNLSKPEVDFIEGLSPAISIDQKTVSANPRSTVGTITEIYDYLRLLYSRIGQPVCSKCGRKMEKFSSEDELLEKIREDVKKRFQVSSGGIYLTVRVEDRDQLTDKTSAKVIYNQKVINLTEDNPDNLKKPNLIIDKLESETKLDEKLNRSITASKHLGRIYSLYYQKEEDILARIGVYSDRYHCPKGHEYIDEINPKLFSFNSPSGACPSCHGLGRKKVVDKRKLVPSPKLTIAEGAIRPWGRKMAGTSKFLEDLSKLGIDINKPYQKLPKEKKEIVLYGKGDYPGAVNHLEERYLKTDSDNIRAQIEEYLVEKVCPSCQGRRLRKLALNVLIEDKSIADLNNLDIKSLKDFFDNFEPQTSYGSKIVDQINDRIDFLLKVGLDYLSLSRSSDSLAGGEAQRVRLATQLGSALSGVIYILDEPTIGLHPSDLEPLLKVVSNLKKNDSTVVMVEHDKETIKAADYIIDLGPGAGRQGGEIVAQGTYQQVKNSNSLTGEYLRGEKRIEIPIRRRKAKKYLEIIGASYRNLKNIDVKIPLGNLVCISGVSGSGKSTLLYDILGKALSKYFYNAKAKPGEHREIKGLNNIDKVIKVNQAPIGRTPRSNPATYVGIFSLIRKEFAETDLAKEREYDAAQFSFNVKKGRCSKCAGQGQKKIEMYFMDDVYVPCPKCQGQRYNSQTLEVELNGKNIAQVLEMTVDQARDFFTAFPKLRRKLEVLQDVGLGYLELGQPATTLSGGEAQRIKLAKELSRKSYNQTLYILDEPTTGLHLDDINRLLKVLNKLVDRGNTVVVIEHNSEVLKAADHIIDLGPGGGEQGGEIVAQGTPEELTENNRSLTGRYIKKALDESK